MEFEHLAYKGETWTPDTDILARHEVQSNISMCDYLFFLLHRAKYSQQSVLLQTFSAISSCATYFCTGTTHGRMLVFDLLGQFLVALDLYVTSFSCNIVYAVDYLAHSLT